MSDEWSNWARQQHCRPRTVEIPGDETELAAAVRRSADAGWTVRPIGSGHSFTALCVTDDVHVDLSRLDRVLDLDHATGVARVQAGITLHALSAELHRLGRALENMGDVDTQTLAGALATGTHGTGARFANLSARMVGGRLVTAEGSVLDVGSDPELLLAARVSLGALGVLSEIHLQTVPAFRLHKVEEVRPLDELLADLDELVAGHDHVELYALPWSTRALLLRSRRTEEPADPPPRWRTWLTDELVNNAGLDVLQRTGRRFPRATPALGRLTGVLASGSERLDDSHRVFASNRRVRFTESEWAVPRAVLPQAVRGVLALIERLRLPVTFPIEVRVAAPDDALLSTAHGRETGYVAVHQYVGGEWSAYFHAVEELMLGLDGRPHWGKRHEAGADVLAPRYPGWQRFQDVRERLDPQGVFTNAHLASTLGPAAAHRASA